MSWLNWTALFAAGVCLEGLLLLVMGDRRAR
jgi:hypothetical protein